MGAVYGRGMTAASMIIAPQDVDAPGLAVRGASLVIQNWPAEGLAREVAPLHVHHVDDEAWHVVSGALRFRFADEEAVAGAGATVLVPAGVAHTFGDAGPEPSRYIIILPARLDEMVSLLHEADPAEHAAIYRRYESELLE
jgi:mannose-6-phosphate isomerase-like protein (cupin superfamily)